LRNALCCERARAAPLAELVYEKDRGQTRFFHESSSSTLFLDEGLLAFGPSSGPAGHGTSQRIHAKGYTTNVADLMVGKLTRLPARTQEGLAAARLPRQAAPTPRRFALVRGNVRGAGPRGTWGRRSPGADRAPRGRLPICARPYPGSCVLADSRKPLRAGAHLRIGRLPRGAHAKG